MNYAVLILTLLLAPLIGFAFNGLRFRSKNAYLAGGVATGAVLVSFACAVTLFTKLLSLPPDARHLSTHFFNWIVVGDLRLPFGFIVDQVSGIMILIITGV